MESHCFLDQMRLLYRQENGFFFLICQPANLIQNLYFSCTTTGKQDFLLTCPCSPDEVFSPSAVLWPLRVSPAGFKVVVASPVQSWLNLANDLIAKAQEGYNLPLLWLCWAINKRNKSLLFCLDGNEVRAWAELLSRLVSVLIGVSRTQPM